MTVTAPGVVRSGEAWATARTRLRRLRVTADGGLGACVAAGLMVIAFLAAGGVDLAPNTWIEIALSALAAAVAVAVVLLGAPGPAWGAVTLALFAALAALTFASIAWSVQPANSWVEANRTLSYLAAFGAAMGLARLFPARWPALVGAVALAATVVGGYALLVKVFPATLDASDQLARLHAPFDYWNATGLIAALGLPACVWAGARRERGRVLRALTVPAIALLIVVIVLSYGRGAVLAVVIGLGLWFALVPLRLRAALVLGIGAAGGAAVSVWALSTKAITHDGASLQSRTVAGHSFGLVLLVALGLLTVAGFAAAFAMDRVTLSSRLRHQLGVALVVLLAMVPVGGVAALASSSRGLSGEVSHIWSTLTSPKPVVSDRPGRLVQVASTRPRYWGEGLTVGEHALLKGVGALGYGTARNRYTRDIFIVEHAHSYAIETFADFGLIGVGVSLALLIAWALAAGRTVEVVRGPPLRKDRALKPSDRLARSGVFDAERTGLITLLAIVVVFGIHSLIDWTWFIPGTAVAALVCAGWLAGRGPLSEPVGLAPVRRRLRDAPSLGAAVLLLAVAAVFAAWVIWQPLRSANADTSALAALTRGDARAALADARSAAASDPVSVEPLWELSAIYDSLGDARTARHELTRAVSVQPSNPATWQQLGSFDLAKHRPQAALGELETALRLNRNSPQITQLLSSARSALGR